jgi:hypothetical protein
MVRCLRGVGWKPADLVLIGLRQRFHRPHASPCRILTSGWLVIS